MRKMRLDRLLSRFGLSRKEAVALIKAGRAAVNGGAFTITEMAEG